MKTPVSHRFLVCIASAFVCALPLAARAETAPLQPMGLFDLWREDPPMQQRYDKCQEENGTWYEELTVSACEDDTAIILLGDEEHRQRCDGGVGGTFNQQCVHFDSDGQAYFNDGPSIPHTLQTTSTSFGDPYDLLLWNDLFWSAGVNHDYCYGYNPVTYGYSREDCDLQFLEDLAATCEHEPHRKLAWFSEEVCRWYAAAMYSAVSVMGDTAWSAQSSEVRYGGWKPLWKEYGLSEQPSTEHLRTYITMSAGALSWWPFYDWLSDNKD